MSARVLVVGFDAAEATLMERLAAEGRMPALARFMERGAGYRLGNSLETLPGAIWPELQTGISAGRLPLYFHPRQLHTGEATARPIEAAEVDPGHYYWVRAARAGRRVAALDMPQSVLAPGLDGIQLLEWGLHDRNFAIASDPPDLLEHIHRRYGPHPARDCDRHQCRQPEYEDLLARLKWGVRIKTDMLGELLAGDDWDLFTCCFAECHCAGHHFWHFQDRRHPWFREDAPAHLRGALADVYALLDTALARLLGRVDADTIVFLLLSHGMGPYTGGPKLLPEFLERIGLSAAGESTLRRELQPRHLVRHLPQSWLPALKRLSAIPQVRRARRAAGGLRTGLESSRTRAAAFENNRCGAIRLNLEGREPHGCVAPGPEAAALKRMIRDELLALRDVASDEPVVRQVRFAEEAFGPDHHPDVPDILVVFRTDLGVIEQVRSPRVGELRVSNFDPGSPRSGDHTVESRLWVTGPGIAPSAGLRAGNVLDLAPTVLGRLGVDAGDGVDGRDLLA